jgi:flavodoxin
VNAIVIYGSRSGNTQKIAEAVAAGLGSQGWVKVLAVDEAPAILPEAIDLVVIGGPTEAHGVTPAVARLIDRLGPSALNGTAVAAFDTRLRWPAWLSGSAAAGIARRLERCGARMIAPPESFLVGRRPNAPKGEAPVLEAGELERAEAWASSLAARAGVLVSA